MEKLNNLQIMIFCVSLLVLLACHECSRKEISEIEGLHEGECKPRCYEVPFFDKIKYCCCYDRDHCDVARAFCELKCLWKRKCPDCGGEMKEGVGVLVRPMVAVSPSAAYMSPAMGAPTPSPFSFSVASTRWSSSKPSIRPSSLLLRGMGLVFSFGSSLALAATMTNNNNQQIKDYPELVYSIVITTLAFVYFAYQLFKGVYDIAFPGVLISDKTSDYISFVFDQMAGYLLMSCSSVTTLAIYRQLENTSLKNAAIVSVCFSVAALLTTTACTILSGYKLSKRIIW